MTLQQSLLATPLNLVDSLAHDIAEALSSKWPYQEDDSEDEDTDFRMRAQAMV